MKTSRVSLKLGWRLVSDMARSLYIVLLLLAVALPNTVCAASFNCTKAGTDQEKMICADSTLSSLDDKLAQTYKSAVLEANTAKAAEIQAQQKEWLRNVRNSCTSKPCLVQAYEKRIHQLASRLAVAPGSASTCPLAEKMLIGAWKHVSGGFFEEMSFEHSGSERIFNSWLHQRPEISGGTWKIEDCTIFIQHATEEKMKFAFRIIRAQGDTIYLRDIEDKTDAVYKRIKP